MMTKLRPFVHSFLKEASNLFEIYIYTMGECSYALEMAKLFDPGNVYFNGKVISQGDCTKRHQKSLDVLLGHESIVLILDDTEAVWENDKHLSTKVNESERNGALSTIIKVLQRIHTSFFHKLEVHKNKDVLVHQDVRHVLRKGVFQGCKLVFSGFPNDEGNHLRKMAEGLGETCAIDVDPFVTHVGTKKSRWAIEEGDNKFPVQLLQHSVSDVYTSTSISWGPGKVSG